MLVDIACQVNSGSGKSASLHSHTPTRRSCSSVVSDRIPKVRGGRPSDPKPQLLKPRLFYILSNEHQDPDPDLKPQTPKSKALIAKTLNPIEKL